jgi:hypothetical protein
LSYLTKYITDLRDSLAQDLPAGPLRAQILSSLEKSEAWANQLWRSQRAAGPFPDKTPAERAEEAELLATEKRIAAKMAAMQAEAASAAEAKPKGDTPSQPKAKPSSEPPEPTSPVSAQAKSPATSKLPPSPKSSPQAAPPANLRAKPKGKKHESS